MHPDNPILRNFDTIRAHVDMVARGLYVCCAASGPPGIGKSRVILAELNAANVRYVALNGQATIAGILQHAYEMRRGGVIFLDDLDSVITGSGATGANIMKSLLDPSKECRSVSITTAAALAGKAPYPAKFETKARFIWATNADLSDPELSAYPPKSRPHIRALLSRGLDPIIISGEPRWVLDYCNDLIVRHDLLRHVRRPLTLQQAVQLRDWFISNADRLPQLSVRVLVDRLAPMVYEHPDNWQRHVDHMLSKEPVRVIEPIELEDFRAPQTRALNAAPLPPNAVPMGYAIS